MSMLGPGSFVYSSVASKVIFGQGTLSQLGAELARIGASRALMLSTPGRGELAGQAEAAADGRVAGRFTDARMHTPVEVTEQALVVLQDVKADALVSVGGGSTTGLGKALALRTGLPQVAVATTYAGSEMTPTVGETKDGLKTVQRKESIRPGTVIYDVDLTLNLPVGTSVTSGMNAIAHAAEALYARDANPVTSLMAEEGIRALASALPAIKTDPHNTDARAAALYGAWLCGICLGTVGMAPHHKLCHVLGGSFDLPHADTHTVILPYAMAYNAATAPEAMQRIARALDSETAAGGLWSLSRRLDAPASLAVIGMPETGIARAAEIAMQNPYWNPRPLEPAAILQLLRRAQTGQHPESM
jgi:maleylacetate reductase